MDPLRKTSEAINSQKSRDNEVQARDKLRAVLSKCTPAAQNIEERSDHTPTTRLLAEALLLLKSEAELPVQGHDKDYGATRRANERDVREYIRKLIPDGILQRFWCHKPNVNTVTKIMLAVAAYIEELRQAKDAAGSADIKDDSSVAKLEGMRSDPVKMDDAPSGTNILEHTTLSLRVADKKSPRHNIQLSDRNSRPVSSFSPSELGPLRDTVQLGSSAASFNNVSSRLLTPHSTKQYDVKPPPLSKTPGIPVLASVGAPHYSQSHLAYDLTMPSAKKSSNSSTKEKYSRNDPGQEPWNAARPDTAWFEQKADSNPVPEVRDIEQVAKRLVAMTKDMLDLAGDPGIDEDSDQPKGKVKMGHLVKKNGISHEDRGYLAWVHDLLVDACTVIGNSDDRRKVVERWEMTRREWDKHGRLRDDD